MLKLKLDQIQLKDLVFCAVIILLTAATGFIPLTKYYKRPASEIEARCEVIRTDDSMVFQRGIFHQGEQLVEVKLLTGPDRGRVIHAMNLLQGSVELEWFYQPGEKAFVGYSIRDGHVVAARMLEPVREGSMLALFLLFFILVFIIGRWVGVKAIVSFAFTVMVIWKILLPLNLEGKIDPVLSAMVIVAVLCFVIIFLVAGFTKKGWCAFLGAFGGSIVNWIVLILFGGIMKINGATAEFSTALRFSGYETLNLLNLFYAAVILSASGAIMDVSMDIAAAMTEIHEKRPDIERGELIRSGLNIGRAVIGTMTTTLLLAYSGGFMTMLMYFMSKGISVARIINMNYMAAEMLKTLSGTIGLALVVPLTAVFGGFILVPLLEKDKRVSDRLMRLKLKEANK